MPTETVVMTRSFKRGPCWYVEGRVLVGGEWRNAAFTAHAPDVESMSREEFQAFALRNLPEVTEDKSWAEHIPR